MNGDPMHQPSSRRGPLFRGALVVAGFTAWLAGCAQVQTATDQAGRDAAKTIMPQTLALYFPQVPKEYFTPFTDCVVDNALAVEVRSLAEDAVVGVDQGTADTVKAILARPQTQDCLRGRIGDDVPVVQ